MREVAKGGVDESNIGIAALISDIYLVGDALQSQGA